MVYHDRLTHATKVYLLIEFPYEISSSHGNYYEKPFFTDWETMTKSPFTLCTTTKEQTKTSSSRTDSSKIILTVVAPTLVNSSWQTASIDQRLGTFSVNFLNATPVVVLSGPIADVIARITLVLQMIPVNSNMPRLRKSSQKGGRL